MKKYPLLILCAALGCVSFTFLKSRPVLYIIGDSTVRNSDGSGRNGQWGWGSVIGDYFDTNRISVQNHAIGGRSSRTFLTDGRWNKLLQTLHKDDYVLIQFGHNDSGALDDTSRARGTIKGIGNDSTEIYNPIRKMKETVHSYGWYLRKYVTEAKEKGAVPIICSPIPRGNWKNGRITRSEYASWAKQVAEETGTFFIDLQEKVAIVYERLDTVKVSSFFPSDKTHTNKEGAIINAEQVVDGVKDLKKCKLKKFIVK